MPPCLKCGVRFKGFGDCCAECRKGGTGGSPKACRKCGSFFNGFGHECTECWKAASSKGTTPSPRGHFINTHYNTHYLPPSTPAKSSSPAPLGKKALLLKKKTDDSPMNSHMEEQNSVPMRKSARDAVPMRKSGRAVVEAGAGPLVKKEEVIQAVRQSRRPAGPSLAIPSTKNGNKGVNFCAEDEVQTFTVPPTGLAFDSSMKAIESVETTSSSAAPKKSEESVQPTKTVETEGSDVNFDVGDGFDGDGDGFDEFDGDDIFSLFNPFDMEETVSLSRTKSQHGPMASVLTGASNLRTTFRSSRRSSWVINTGSYIGASTSDTTSKSEFWQDRYAFKGTGSEHLPLEASSMRHRLKQEELDELEESD